MGDNCLRCILDRPGEDRRCCRTSTPRPPAMPHTFPFREHILEHRASPPGTTAAELAPICKELHSMSNYRVQNPATGEIVETFPEATDAEIESTVAAAHSTYLTWKDTDIQERAEIVRRAAEIFHERKDELAKTISTEM